jgi:hypothetical protein
MKKLIILASLISVIVGSCKKGDNEPTPPEKTTLEKLLGVWKPQNLIFNDYAPGSFSSDTTVGTPTDYLEFRNNGKSYLKFQNLSGNNIDSSLYTIVTDSSINIEGQFFKLRNLNGTNLTLYSKETTSSNPLMYEEIVFNLKK